jgi:hypothetical protein
MSTWGRRPCEHSHPEQRLPSLVGETFGMEAGAGARTHVVRDGEVEDLLEGIDRVPSADRVLLSVADMVVGCEEDLCEAR